jgi:hypothetical protein
MLMKKSFQARGTWRYCVDADGDGYVETCVRCITRGDWLMTLPAMTVYTRTEICDNGIDDNCDGNIDEGCSGTAVIGDFQDGGVVLGEPYG